MKSFEKPPLIYHEPELDKAVEVEEIMKDVFEKASALLEKLRREIEEGKYSVILGIDGSGRVPAILLAKAIKKIYTEIGHQQPIIRFIAGQRYSDHQWVNRDGSREESHQDKVTQYFQEQLAPAVGPQEKVLVIDDNFMMGNTLKGVAQALSKSGIKFQLATLGVSSVATQKNKPRVSTGLFTRHKVMVGDSSISLIYRKPTMSGVDKRQGDLHARRLEDSQMSKGEYTGPQVLKHVRDITNQYADELADQFLAKYNRDTL